MNTVFLVCRVYADAECDQHLEPEAVFTSRDGALAWIDLHGQLVPHQDSPIRENFVTSYIVQEMPCK